MLLYDGPLSTWEYNMGEKLPIGIIHDAVLHFLVGRDDAAVFGAMAVNAYVSEVRGTMDVDILSTSAKAFAEELRAHLNEKFHIAVRVRSVAKGKGLRIYQVRKPENRHLVDVRPVKVFPPVRRHQGYLVIEPPELIAQKVMALSGRRGSPKSGTDWRDVTVLLLTFPKLKTLTGAVSDRLVANGADAAAMACWRELVETEIRIMEDEAEFG